MTAVGGVETAAVAEATDAPRVCRATTIDWIAALLPIALWVVHLTFEAAFVRYTANHGSAHWILHLATVLTAVPTAACLYWSGRVVRRAHASVDAGDECGQLSFVGWLGVGIGAFNLTLIVWEGAYVFFLSPHAV